jgi:hypothetical protein
LADSPLTEEKKTEWLTYRQELRDISELENFPYVTLPNDPDKFTGTNTSGANVTISVNIVPNGGTAGGTNLVVDTRTIAPNETYTFPELVGHVLPPSGFISTIAGTASAIVIRASGREIT